MTVSASNLPPVEAIQRLLDIITKPARLLVAISGGSDSTGLLVTLSKANSPGSGISLFAATVDHALRPESAEEALSVAALCSRLGIAHVIRRWEGEKPEAGLSAASREARYRLLAEIADEIDATAILTGHTRDDQAETVAMRAARSGREDNLGLAGMAEAVLLERRRWLLRPLLKTRRADIRAFLTNEGESWIDDPSNLNPHYERVRVRGKLATEGSFDAAALTRAVKRRTALSDAAARLVHDHVTIRLGVLAHLAPAGLAGDGAVRRHALSLLSAVLGGRAHALRGESMNRVMAFLDSGRPGRITAGRVIFDLRRDGLYLARENRGLMPLHVPPGQAAVWDGRYRITNGSACEIIVGPTVPDREEALFLFPDAPPALAMRAMSVMPWVEANSRFSPAGRRWSEGPDEGGEAREQNAEPAALTPPHRLSTARHFSPPGRRGSSPIASSQPCTAGQIHIKPTLAPFDRFLPQFDLNLASEFAVLLGCDVFPPLPVKDSARKS
ncbi:tRNA lysidine(34) synthetase TilS [Neorhizobium petrolearium]|uniref:tRNA lysidine(34) synthetase TilS n=1 Tax=Neorhizobium petrolearium TaxID=515361 RepID=UPI003F7D8AC9